MSRKCGYRLGSLDFHPAHFTALDGTWRGGIDSRAVCVAAGGGSATLKLPHHFFARQSNNMPAQSARMGGGDGSEAVSIHNVMLISGGKGGKGAW